MIEITGQIERITFTNEENGYTVARVSVEGRQEPATVVGILHDPAPGTTLRMRGEWMLHPRFGTQFKLAEYETVVPKSSETIERYLAAGAVKGIGPVTARQIVERFGPESLRIMDEQIERLREISGIGRKRLERIRRSWGEQKELREVMLFLEGNGVSPAYAAKIYRRYGGQAVALVRKDPYRIAGEIPGIGFLTADRIAAALGYPSDGEKRLEAGLLYCLERASDEGHLFLPAAELLRRAAELLAGDESLLRGVLSGLARRGRLIAERAGERPAAQQPAAAAARGEDDPELGDAAAIYTPRLHECELAVARRLLAASRHAGAPPKGGTATPAARSGGEAPAAAPAARPAAAARPAGPDEPVLTLGADQRAAIAAALANGVTVITGGPGTGKTTVIDAVARALTRTGRRVVLAAPTGRAAKRMAEAAGREAKTIHRLLEGDPHGGAFRRNARNPLECDALILDESSMVDTPLAAALFDALPQGARLVMVGDAEQLPSVGPGNLLGDVIASGAIPVVRLTEIHRQQRDSRIVAGAHEIIGGRIPDFATGEEGDLYLIEQSDPERVVGLLVTLVRERIPRRFGLDPFDDIQVLTPMNRGPSGTLNLNSALQEALNPAGRELSRGSRSFRVGDKVMQVRNNYELDVFNGDIGRIKQVDEEAAELVVTFDGTDVRYSAEELDELSLAYAVTVHKAQGSEFPAVVIPLLTQHYLLLQRNLLYTAVTRGKRLVVIVGSRRALALAVGNDRTRRRNTRLAALLAAEDHRDAEKP